MKKTFLLPVLAVLAGTALCAAEFPPEPPRDQPPAGNRCEGRNPAMQCGQRQKFQQGCPMMKKGRRNGCEMMPKAPMNEDEMAKFALLRQAVRDAHEDYRADASEKNLNALRTAIDNLVSASQQFEIDRCEKALARAKAAVSRKDQIVTRQLKRMTCKPGPKPPMPPAPVPAPGK